MSVLKSGWYVTALLALFACGGGGGGDLPPSYLNICMDGHFEGFGGCEAALQDVAN